MKILATIDLDHGAGEGQLFWDRGSIWCREPDGREHDTGHRCRRREAETTIAEVWGDGWSLWYPGR